MKNILRVGIVLLFPVLLFAQSTSWTVPESDANMDNPREANDASIEAGKVAFETFCQMCHGEGGAGDGAMLDMLRIESMPDFTDAGTLGEQSDGTLFFKIGNKGENKMPAFAARVTEEQRWDIVNFLRTLSD